MGEIKNDNLMYQFWLSGIQLMFSTMQFLILYLGMKSFLGIADSRTYVFDQLKLDYQNKDSMFFVMLVP